MKLLYLFYNLIMIPVLIFALLPYFFYLLIKGRGREIFDRLGFLAARDFKKARGRKVIWLQAASVGEVRVARQVIDWYSSRDDNFFFLLTVMTPQGRKLAKEEVNRADLISYLPVDWGPLLLVFIKKIKPDLLLLIETELWPALIRESSRQKVPVAVVNGRISRGSFGKYKFFSCFFRPFLEMVKAYHMQSPLDQKRIIEMGAPSSRVFVSDNIKLAEVLQDKENMNYPERDHSSYNSSLLEIEGERKVIVAGSTHPPEEEKILEIFNSLRSDFPELLLILAPRHIERREEIKFILQQRGLSYQQRSSGTSVISQESAVFLLDTLGELRGVYSLADLVFLGGTLSPVGGHNFLEPLAREVPVITGPQVDNIKSLLPDFQKSGAVIILKNIEQIEESCRELLQDPLRAEQLGRQGYELLVKKSQSALEQLEAAENLRPLAPASRKVLFVRLSALGDVIHTLPAVNWMAKLRPEYEIHWLVEPLAAPLVKIDQYIDRVHVLPKNRWRGNDRKKGLELIRDIRAYFSSLAEENFDLSLDFHGLFKSSFSAFLSSPEIRYGPESGREGSRIFYQRMIAEDNAGDYEYYNPEPKTDCSSSPESWHWQRPNHRVFKNLKLMASALGKKLPGDLEIDYGLSLPEDWHNHLDREIQSFFLNYEEIPLIVVHPLTSWPSKNWPIEKYRRLISLLAGLPVKIVISGAQEEREKLEQVKPGTSSNIIMAAGRLELPELYGLLLNSDLFLGGDTGPLHLAAAAGTKVAAIMGPTDPETHGPFTSDHKIFRKDELICLNCWEKKCPYGHHKCMEELTVNEVLAELEEMIELRQY